MCSFTLPLNYLSMVIFPSPSCFSPKCSLPRTYFSWHKSHSLIIIGSLVCLFHRAVTYSVFLETSTVPDTYNEFNQCVNPGKVLVYTNSPLFLECLFHHSFPAHSQIISLLDANTAIFGALLLLRSPHGVTSLF